MNTYFNRNIERIICPIDFTATGKTGLEYAGLLAKALGAELTIFYVQPSDTSGALQLYEDLNDDERVIRRLMKMEAEALRDAGVRCDCSFEPAADFEMGVGAMSADYDLIVIGTNGADNLYQHVFGPNSHHVLGLARCPVLMIPETSEVRLPRMIVYAFDPETNPAFLVGQIEDLALPLKAEVRTFKVLPEPGNETPKRKMELLAEVLGVKEKPEFDWSFEPSYSDEAVSEVDEYMKREGADLLALSYRHRAVFEKLFSENVLKEVSRIADYPVLVFWH
jgi:nucleotide-binding universal stress UspA family protein